MSDRMLQLRHEAERVGCENFSESRSDLARDFYAVRHW